MALRAISLWFAFLAVPTPVFGQEPKAAAPQLKNEMRMPWARSDERFIRRWLALGDIPLATGGFDKDWLTEHGGEAAIHPAEKMAHKLPNGSTVAWRELTAWGDAVDLSDGIGLKRDVLAYAYAKVSRREAGKALLSIGSDESIRVWLNGAIVLDRSTRRPLTFDEDQVEVDMQAGDNSLLVKLEQRAGAWTFAARVLERGAIPPRIQEIGPSLNDDSPSALVIRTDINCDRAALDKVTVQAVAPGGRILAETAGARGESVRLDPRSWPDGAYEIRCSTHRRNGLMYATHLPWYKGDSIAAARALVAAGATNDRRTPNGFTVKMLADLVTDRLGKDLASVAGNPWWAIHSPLMEFEELRMEDAGRAARERPYGFVRLAWRDEIDGSPQFCRAYLPGGYDHKKKWPLVIHIHGYNPANPDYVRWWSVDQRHNVADVEYGARQGVIYMEPHGRGNNNYLGLGDQDVVRAIRLAKERFSVDEERVYLVGDSMGGWGTWNVATRHPDLFAAIAPIYGGSDYHSQYTEEALAKLTPLERFLAEKHESSWAMAEGLLNVPILVHHGDVDRSVNVDYSRYGVRLLERWGYNVRYVELPGYGHEELSVMSSVIDWFLQHRRVTSPQRVRLRSAELENASAYWVSVEQAASPREFMVVDAEVTGPNTIRVDSQNVLALSLAPSIVDASRPVRVVWNGELHTIMAGHGRLALTATGYQKADGEKSPVTAGPIGEIFNTPFAIVTGTASADPAMKEMCRRKSEAAVNLWKQWQRQPPRVFLDSEISDGDAARYSLLLIGGAEANLVARRLGRVDIAPDHVTIQGRSFAATGARVQAIYPNPLNPQRYVLLVGASSAGALSLWTPDRLRDADFDFVIEDGRVPSGTERVSQSQMWVAGGWFDRRWKIDDSLIFPGNPEVRSKSAVLQPDRVIDPTTLASYTGAYQIAPGFTVKVKLAGQRLVAQPGEQATVELIPASDMEFYALEGPVRLVFEKDAAGKTVSFKGWQNGQQFAAKKID
jgi:pimeloyl-ACP methyl ester carboxylesterase